MSFADKQSELVKLKKDTATTLSQFKTLLEEMEYAGTLDNKYVTTYNVFAKLLGLEYYKRIN